MNHLAQKGVGVKKLAQQSKKHERITAISDKNGDIKLDADDISELFAAFYENLYDHENGTVPAAAEDKGTTPDVTAVEVVAALQRMKKDEQAQKMDWSRRC